MSIKIYDGYKVTLKDDAIWPLWDMLDDVTQKIRALADKTCGEQIVYEAISEHDRYVLGMRSGLRKDVKDPARDATQSVIEKKGMNIRLALSLVASDMHARACDVKRTNLRDPEIDYSCSIALVRDGKDLLAIIYTEHQMFQDIWSAAPGVEPWPYWNNSDRPDDLTEEQWDQRAKSWERALNGYGPAGEAGIIKEVIPIGWTPKMGFLGNAMEEARKIGLVLEEKGLTPALRADTLAKETVFNEKMKELCPEAKDIKGFLTQEYEKAVKWIKENPEVAKAKASEYQPKLDPVAKLFDQAMKA